MKSIPYGNLSTVEQGGFREDGRMFKLQYRCPDCGEEWTDIWSCVVDAECPDCGDTCEAVDYYEVRITDIPDAAMLDAAVSRGEFYIADMRVQLVARDGDLLTGVDTKGNDRCRPPDTVSLYPPDDVPGEAAAEPEPSIMTEGFTIP